MRSIPQNLQNHISSGVTTLCNCWKITRNDGVIKGFTDHDNDLVVSGLTYEASSGFVGSEAISRIGLSVDSMEIHSALSSGSLVEIDLSNGLYDNAEVELYLVNWQDTGQNIVQRRGTIGEVKRGSLSFMAEVRGVAHNLQQPQGRLFQQSCDAEIGDGRCQVDLAASAFSVIALVSAVSADQSFKTADLIAYPSGWFKGGSIEWLSGENLGAIAEIKSHRKLSDSETNLSVWQNLSKSPALGDQFKLLAGCNKSFATCKAKFSNQINFRGFPHIPGNDYIIKTPSQNDGTQDGSSQN